MHSHLSGCVSSSSALPPPSVSKKFSFAEFFRAKLGLQQKSVIESECKRGFSVVDKPSFTELYSANYPSFPKQNNNNRLLRFQMGDMIRERSFSRTPVRRRNKMAHKFNRFDSQFYRSEVVCGRGQHYLTHTSLQMDNMTACHYINNIGKTVSANLCMLALDMWKWCQQRNIHISAVYIPGQLNFIADILSRLLNLNSG